MIGLEPFHMSSTVRIVKTSDTLHGNPRLEGTRVGVLQVGELVRECEWPPGAVAEQLDLDIEQVRAAVAYYDEHPELMETLRTQKDARQQSVADRSRAE